jgi:hypothetical protein
MKSKPSAEKSVSLLNRIPHLDSHLARLSESLTIGSLYTFRAITAGMRRNLITLRYPHLKWLTYPFDYLWHRVCSKLAATRRLYYKLTHGETRVMSRVEMLGRICRAGFEIVDEEASAGGYRVVCRKAKEPVRDVAPSRGILIRLWRIGKNGQPIGVYKFRTMYAYSEYLQAYVYEKEGLEKGDKIINDFRVNQLGKFLRRYWFDELPQLINLLKGDIKLIGVRPLSQHKLSLYNDELKQLRLRTKPGLIPPFYADMPDSMEELEASELCYLNAYLQHPYRTDWRYFRQCMYNILWKGKRSK